MYPEPDAHGERPLHPWHDVGCIRGWEVSAFVRSVIPYTRRRIEGGGRVQNHALDEAGAGSLVWEAVRAYETAQERVQAEYHDLLSDRS